MSKTLYVSSIVTLAVLCLLSYTGLLQAGIPLSTDPNCLVWLPLEEGLGSVAANYGGMGGVAVLAGMLWDTNVPSPLGVSLSSNGDGTLDFPLAGQEIVEEFTVSGWFYLPEAGAGNRLWRLRSGSGSILSVQACAIDCAALAVVLEYPWGGQHQIPGTIPFPVGEWTHHALTWSAEHQVVTVFENGTPIPITGNRQALGGLLNSVQGLRVDSLSGGVDDLRVYDRSMNGREIRHLQTAHPSSARLPTPEHDTAVKIEASLTLDWEAPESVADFNVYAGPTPETLVQVASHHGESTLVLDRATWGLENGGYWQVESLLSDGVVRGPLWQFHTSAQTAVDLVSQQPGVNNILFGFYGMEAPELILEDQFGQVHVLSTYEGRTVLLKRGRPTCSECVREVAHLKKLYRDMGRDELQIFIYGNPTREAEFQQYWFSDPGMEIPISLKGLYEVDVPFNQVQQVPTMFFIDPAGFIKTITLLAVPEHLVLGIIDAAPWR